MRAVDDTLTRAAKLLCSARRPAILVGPEGASAIRALLQIADRLGAALLTTPDALSLVDHRRSCGTFSFGASALARAVMDQADVVLAVSALGEFTCRLGEAFRGRHLIQVTERASDIGRNAEPTLVLVGATIEESLQRLQLALARRLPKRQTLWFNELVEANRAQPAPAERPGLIQPVAAMSAVAAALPAVARLCLDVTSGALHAYQHLKLTTSQRVFSSIENSACMGEALMASLGIRLASNLPTLTLVGDWGYCMAPAELHTAVELGLDRYVVLIWANGGGAFIGAGVKQQGIAVPDRVWRWRSPPSFGAIASGYGAEGVTVTDATSLGRELSRAFSAPHPVVIEAKIDPEALVPAGDRFLTLGDSRSARAPEHKP